MYTQSEKSESRIKQLEISVMEYTRENDKIKVDLHDKEERLLHSIEENKLLLKSFSEEQIRSKEITKRI